MFLLAVDPASSVDLVSLISVVTGFLLGFAGLAYGAYKDWIARNAFFREKLWEKRLPIYEEIMKFSVQFSQLYGEAIASKFHNRDDQIQRHNQLLEFRTKLFVQFPSWVIYIGKDMKDAIWQFIQVSGEIALCELPVPNSDISLQVGTLLSKHLDKLATLARRELGIDRIMTETGKQLVLPNQSITKKQDDKKQ